MKKGQVTIFIIIGMIILTSFLILYMNNDNLSGLDTGVQDFTIAKNNRDMVKTYVGKCLEDTGTAGLYLLANNGGQIYSYDNMLLTENTEISYITKSGDNDFFDPLIVDYQDSYGSLYNEDVAPTEESMITQLNIFVATTMLLCLKKVDFKDLDLEYGSLTVESEFKRSETSIHMDFPITLIEDGQRTIIDNYNVNLPFRMQKIIDTRDEIIELILVNELTLTKLAERDMKIYILPYNRNDIIYSIHDEKSGVREIPFIFNFAIHNDFNIAPILEPIPDFLVKIGKLFNYTVNGSDYEKNPIIYTSTNQDIKINENGSITFFPTRTGIMNTTICIIDRGNKKDCEYVRFKVE